MKNHKFNNTVIKAISPEHGEEVLQWWRNQGVDTTGWFGNCNVNPYYGLKNGWYCNLSKYEVENENLRVITLRDFVSSIPQVPPKTITLSQAQEIIDCACITWKEKLYSVWGNKIVVSRKDITITDSLYKEMRGACSSLQHVVLDGIFGSEMIEEEEEEEILFTTEDGVDIKDGDNYWIIFPTQPFRCVANQLARDGYYRDCGHKRFSTEKLAEEHIKKYTVLFTTEDGVDIYHGDKYLGLRKDGTKYDNIGNFGRPYRPKTLRFYTESARNTCIKDHFVIFTTEDNTDIYEGEIYYYVNTVGEIISHIHAGKNKYLDPSNIRFSTRKLAEEYILKRNWKEGELYWVYSNENWHLRFSTKDFGVFYIVNYVKGGGCSYNIFHKAEGITLPKPPKT